MNRNFVKPREDMTPEFAPDVLEINGRKVYNPKAVHCKIAGYLPLSPDWPVDPPEGKHYERTDKIECDGDGYKWVYRLVDNPPPPPRRWTRLSIKTALAQAGMLDAAKRYLANTVLSPTSSYTALEALTDCNYVEEGYPTAERWNALLDGAAVALGKTREEIDAFLDAIPREA